MKRFLIGEEFILGQCIGVYTTAGNMAGLCACASISYNVVYARSHSSFLKLSTQRLCLCLLG